MRQMSMSTSSSCSVAARGQIDELWLVLVARRGGELAAREQSADGAQAQAGRRDGRADRLGREVPLSVDARDAVERTVSAAVKDLDRGGADGVALDLARGLATPAEHGALGVAHEVAAEPVPVRANGVGVEHQVATG